MAQCLNCGRSGLFLSVSVNGLCKNCDPIVGLDVRQRARIITESAKLIGQSTKLDTQLSRCDLFLQHAKALLLYERKGIPTVNPLPSSLIEQYQKKRNTLLCEGLERIVNEAIAKANLSPNIKTKIGHASKAFLKLREYHDMVASSVLLEGLGQKLRDYIHRAQLGAYLEAANKAAFKGDKKKALDQYYEALYLLKHDEVDDALQVTEIGQIEAKIAALEKEAGASTSGIGSGPVGREQP